MPAGGGREVVLGTRSVGKVRELLPMLAAAGLVPRTLDELGVAEDAAEAGLEVYDSFEANALAKARWYSARCGGRLVLAEDTGLMVDALGGQPGVRSKRFSGRDDLDGAALDAANRQQLLDALAAVGAHDREARTARFVCVAVLVGDGGCWVGRGESEGTILPVPSGSGGFGYDALFFSAVLQRGFAEVGQAEKARVSHRGRAVQAVLAAFRGVVDGARD